MIPANLQAELGLIVKLLEYAGTHGERGNVQAVRESVTDAAARIAKLLEALPPGAP